jgi:hypothetical protein
MISWGATPAAKERCSTLYAEVSHRTRKWLILTTVVVVFVAIGVGVPLGLHFSHQHHSTSADQGSPNYFPTISPNNTVSSTWRPKNGTSWQIVLLNPPTLRATTYALPHFAVWDIDLFDNPSTTFSDIHNLGSKAICYFSAGTYEDWRPDASQFQPSDLGSPLVDWDGERWLNTSSTNVRKIMLARLELSVTKGCDGVDPDNVDGYDNDNGLGLTQASALDYINFLADAAHLRNLSIGLKNAGDIVPDVINKVEWSVQEQCVRYDECDSYRPFLDQGKPVFHIEYPKGAATNNNASIATSQKGSICRDKGAKGFSTIIKNMDLDQWIETC